MVDQANESSLVPLTVSDIKQFLYCPRIGYFRTVLPVEHAATFKMEHGKEMHDLLDRLEKRRTLARYRLKEGIREFHVHVFSHRLGLSGVVDMIFRTPEGIIPVEFKASTREPGINHKYQLVAYAMLLEDVFQAQIRSGFIYLVPTEKIHLVPITASSREYVKGILGAIRNMIRHQQIPVPTRSRRRCRECEFANFCRDMDRRRTTRYVELLRASS